jgi:hypothetical protein
MSPFALFGVASFFIRSLLNEPLCIFFGVASFFIRCLLNELMNEESDTAPVFMALIVCVKCLLNFLLTLLAVSTLF